MNRRKNAGPMIQMGPRRAGGQKAKNFKKGIADLFNYLKKHLLAIIITIIFTIGATIIAIAAPVKLGELSGAIVAPDGVIIDEVVRIGIILGSMYILAFILNYAQAFIMAGVNQKITQRFRSDISKKINRVPLKYFDTNSTGDTLSRVTNDVDTIGQSLNQSFTALIGSAIMLVGILIMMFWTSWQLAFTAILTVPLSIIIMTLVMKLSQKHFVAQQKELGALNGHIEETYSGLHIVKAFNSEVKSQKHFDTINRKLFNSNRKASFYSGLMMPIMNFVANLGFVAICVVGGILLINGQATIPVMVTFFVYVRLFQNPLGQIAQAMGMLQQTAAASERVFEFLNETEQESEIQKDKLLENIKGKVEFRNVRFGYNEEKTIIHDFSAIIEPGSKIAIVGPTGAGKTTIINLLMRFYEIDSGEILIDDIPISELKRENVRALFGMVLQDTWLFEGTIKENIIYAKENVSDEEVYKACEAANIDHFIKTLPNGYNLVLSDDVVISSGQKQLLTIARAMVQDSPMLILDEATSNVDTRTEQLIQDAMDKVAKGKTSFVIAHRLSTIKNADLILVLKDGDIIESGKHEELLGQAGFYHQLYHSQFVLNGEES
ncbi:MAG: ABC transporter ATP-binding protein/permease [Erysipelotrichales bacterium]|nr:ABC transporter ATP-binding protein/permease [Erysipelotrichales bacterium]